MSLNLATAAFFTALVEFALGMGLLILWLREGRRYLACWSAGFIAFGFGSLLISARNQIPDFFSIIVANFSTTLSSALLYVGICLFFGRRHSWLPWVVLGLEAAGLAYYTYVAYDTSARVYVYSVSQALIVLVTLQALFMVGRERAGRSNPEVVIVTVLLLAVHLARIAGTPFFPLPQDFMSSGNFQTLLSFGLLMIHASYALALGNMHASGLNAELSAALAEAKVKERQKIEILSYIGHDLRAPLATISGYSEILLADVHEKQRRMLLAIQRIVKYQMDLTDELLEYAKVELRPLTIQSITTDFPDLLRNISDYATILCRQKNNQFIFQSSGQIPRKIDIDEKRLQQVLLNLISNAAKFTHHGRVVLSIKVEPLKDTWVLFCSVSDTGVGIDLSRQADVFSAFQHINSVKGGTGLGLFIAHRIVSAMGSTLRVASLPGQGSEFSFELSVPVLDASDLEWSAAIQQDDGCVLSPKKFIIAKDAMPDDKALDELSDLAAHGQFTDIEYWIECHAQGAAHAAFAAHLYELLELFDFSAIRALALSCRNQKAAGRPNAQENSSK